MTKEARRKMLHSQDALVVVLLLNQFLLYIFAVQELVNYEVGYSTFVSVVTTGMWFIAFCRDKTLFDCCNESSRTWQ